MLKHLELLPDRSSTLCLGAIGTHASNVSAHGSGSLDTGDLPDWPPFPTVFH